MSITMPLITVKRRLLRLKKGDQRIWVEVALDHPLQGRVVGPRRLTNGTVRSLSRNRYSYRPTGVVLAGWLYFDNQCPPIPIIWPASARQSRGRPHKPNTGDSDLQETLFKE